MRGYICLQMFTFLNLLIIVCQATCAAMGILLHFCLLVSFMWMGIEGLRLCRMVLYVFNLRDWTLYYVLAAYIIPIIIVGVTVLTAQSTTTIISAYTGDETYDFLLQSLKNSTLF